MAAVASFTEKVDKPLYSRLKTSSSIRILKLNPVRDNRMVNAMLIETTVDEAKKTGFVAMSYCWGEPRFDHEIELNSCQKKLTLTVFQMVQQLAKNRPGYYWIDQICINQADLDERATQVLLMTQIYQGASHVEVWLGLEQAEDAPAFQWIENIVPKLVEIFENDKLGAADKAISSRELLNDSSAPSMNGLLENEWYSRLWTVQEVIVNPRPVLMRRGSLLVDFDVLSDFGLLLGRDGRVTLLSEQAGLGIDLFLELRNMRDPEHYERYFTTALDQADLLDVITNTRRRECMDPRDRIYALAGLCSPQHLPYPPSYVEPVEVIYMDFAIHRLCISNSLRILEWCRWSPARLPNLPSWAPDWTHLSSSLGTPWKVRENLRIYSAGGRDHGQYQNMSISRPKRALTLKGVVFDRIRVSISYLSLCKSLNEAAGIVQSYPDIGNGIQVLLDICGPLSPFHMPWDSFWRFLFCDKSINDQGRTRALPEDENAARVYINQTIYLAHTDRFEKQRQLVSSGNLDLETVETRLHDEPRYGEALAHFTTKSSELIRLPSNPLLSFIKEKSIIWGMRYDDLKIAVSKTLQRMTQKIKPTPPPQLKYPDPVANPNNQFKVTQDAGALLQHITRNRSFAITESGRYAWVPEDTIEGDQLVILLAYDLPMVARRLEDNDTTPWSSNTPYAKKERPDQYRTHEPGEDLLWVSDEEEALESADQNVSGDRNSKISTNQPDSVTVDARIGDSTATRLEHRVMTDEVDAGHSKSYVTSDPIVPKSDINPHSEVCVDTQNSPIQELQFKPSVTSKLPIDTPAETQFHTTAWPRLGAVQKVRGEKYILIGEAYVHGVMDGEIVEDMEQADVRELVFV